MSKSIIVAFFWDQTIAWPGMGTSWGFSWLPEPKNMLHPKLHTMHRILSMCTIFQHFVSKVNLFGRTANCVSHHFLEASLPVGEA